VRCAASVSLASATETLLAWARSKSLDTSKVVVSVNMATNEPLLVAARDCSPGEALVTVPDALWLSPEAVAQSPIGERVAGLEPWLQLSLYVLAEKANPTPGGALRAYVDSLPSSLESPLFWSDEELAMLQGTQLLENVQAYKWVARRAPGRRPQQPAHWQRPARPPACIDAPPPPLPAPSTTPLLTPQAVFRIALCGAGRAAVRRPQIGVP